MSALLHKAVDFATIMHGGQDRKYLNTPYISHPLAVMELVRTVTDDEVMLCAAVLHDVVEDTPCTIEQLRHEFGPEIATMVDDLTDVSKPDDGNRAARKALDLQHTSEAMPASKTIKLADLIHNSESIIKHGKGFAKVFMEEKRLLLQVLKEGDPTLWQMADDILFDYFEGVSGE